MKPDPYFCKNMKPDPYFCIMIPAAKVAELRKALDSTWGSLPIPDASLIKHFTSHGLGVYTDSEDITPIQSGLLGKRFDEVDVAGDVFYTIALIWELPPQFASYYLGSYLHYAVFCFEDPEWEFTFELPLAALFTYLERFSEECAKYLSHEQLAFLRLFIEFVISNRADIPLSEDERNKLLKTDAFIEEKLK